MKFKFNVGYVTIKDSKYLKIKIVNTLYLIFNELNGYFEKIEHCGEKPEI